MKKKLSQIISTVAVFLMLGAGARAADSPPRERLLMDSGWSFHLGNEWGTGMNLSKAASSTGPASPTFSDAGWRKVNLPHDWAVELPFDQNSDMAHGYKPVGPGFASNSVAWYRRSFDMPAADAGKRVWLEFDGVYRDSDVFVNGWFVGNHKGGYNGFRYDITDVVNHGGNNVVAVKVDASEFEGWFYEGAGIYRHVWLEKTAPLAIAPDGIFITTPEVSTNKTRVQVQTEIQNKDSESSNTHLVTTILDPNGKEIATQERGYDIDAGSKSVITQNLEITSPKLWSPESPTLYTVVTEVWAGGEIVDRKETEFGIRTVAFDKDKGFLLNGKPYPIQGTCNHQDMAGVGAALPDAMQYFRIAKLKEMGCNAYRTSHNAPTPEMLEACDHLGMLVLDENRLVGSDEENLNCLESQILRDRNHPSVFAWSLGNEEWGSQGTASGAASIRTMQNLAHSLDPTRECTAAVNGSYGNTGFITVLDVKGFNYNLGSIDPYRRNHTNSFFIGTETASTVTTRGIYANDLEKGYVAAYDYITKNKGGTLVNPVTWGETAEQWWSFYAARPWLSGGFAWTGFDYRGEPTPYEWPCINSHFGIMDMCGFPKDNFYYYQSWWTDKPVLHLLPHWNWPGKEGQEIDVRALSNCEEVELFLNGQSLGRQTMKKNSELKWMVKYAPGTLSAKGYQGGKVIAETKVETTGEPAAIQLAPDRETINADGEDLSIIAVSVTDAQGRVVPVASNMIHFELAGPGKILGVGNGDPSSHEADKYVEKVNLLPVTNWKQQTVNGTENRPEVAFDFDDSGWQAAFGGGDRGGGAAAAQTNVYRGTFELTENMDASKLTLSLRSMGEEQTIYLNGKPVAEKVPRDNAVREFALDASGLRPGKNTIAIVATPIQGGGRGNRGGRGGGSPASIRVLTPPGDWQRSVFNGLAQIIVQSTKETGEIKLTATSAESGLPPATVTVQSQLCTPRPFVP